MFSFLVCLEFAMLDVAKVNYTFSHYRMEGASLSVLVTQLQLTLVLVILNKLKFGGRIPCQDFLQ